MKKLFSIFTILTILTAMFASLTFTGYAEDNLIFSLDPTTISDSTGTVPVLRVWQNGTAPEKGSFTSKTGKTINYLNFDSDMNSFLYASNAACTGKEATTVSMWVNFDNFTQGYQHIFDLAGFSPEVMNKLLNIQLESDNTASRIAVTDISETWANLVFTRTFSKTDGAETGKFTYKYYLNGKLVKSYTSSVESTSSSGTFKIGSGGSISVDHKFQGKMAALKVYDKELSESEISIAYGNEEADYEEALTGKIFSLGIDNYDGTAITDTTGNTSLVSIYSNATKSYGAPKASDIETLNGTVNVIDFEANEAKSGISGFLFPSNLVNNQSPLTISTWVKFDNVTDRYQHIFANGSKSSNFSPEFYKAGNYIYIRFAGTTKAISDISEKWTHFIFQRNHDDGVTTYTSYINGTQLHNVEVTETISESYSEFFIGNGSPNDGAAASIYNNQFVGQMGLFDIYADAFTQEDATAEFESTASKFATLNDLKKFELNADAIDDYTDGTTYKINNIDKTGTAKDSWVDSTNKPQQASYNSYNGATPYIAFTGVERMTTTVPDAWKNQNAVTYSAWAYSDDASAASGDTIFSVNNKTLNSSGGQLRIYYYHGKIYLTGAGNTNLASYTVKNNLSKWNFFTVTRTSDGTDLTYNLYLNGKLLGTSTQQNTAIPTEYFLTIGSVGNDGALKGGVGYMTMYTTALTPEQIASEYDSTKTSFKSEEDELVFDLDIEKALTVTTATKISADKTGNITDMWLCEEVNRPSIGSFETEEGTTSYLNFKGVAQQYIAAQDDAVKDKTLTPVIVGQKKLSVSTWIKVSDVINNYQNIFNLSNGTRDTTTLRAEINNNSVYLVTNVASEDENPIVCTADLSGKANKWVNIVFTREYIDASNTKYQIYVDGTLKSESTVARGISAEETKKQWYIGSSGASAADTANALKGLMGEFKIYNNVLSGERVNSYYTASLPSFSERQSITLTGVSFYSDVDEIKALKGISALHADVSLKNNSADAQSCYIVMAIYEDNKLADIQSTVLEIGGNAQNSYMFGGDDGYAIDVTENTKVKVFVWDYSTSGSTTMKPLADVQWISYTEAGGGA